jgi:signal transduction histidine kinase
MPEWLTNGFMPHGYCLRWDVPLLCVFIAGNLGISLAYFVIPLALRYFIGKRSDLPYAHMFKLFAAFILSCGLTHLVKIWTLFQPVYWLEAGVDLWTAFVSLLTATMLFPLIPQALQLRSPKELEKANALLQETNDRLQKSTNELNLALEANQHLLSTVSHDVRNPMSGVIGLAELLSFQDLGQANNQNVGAIFDSSQQVLQLLDNILEANRLREGKVILENAHFELESLFKEVVRLITAQALLKGLKLDYRIAGDCPKQVCGDELRLRQILLNLASNAIKFSNKGSVLLEAETVAQQNKIATIRFSVMDTGPGIAPEQQENLFKRYSQIKGDAHKYGGSGLGLSICDELVKLMEGKIGLKSELGKGSTFWFEISFNEENCKQLANLG